MAGKGRPAMAKGNKYDPGHGKADERHLQKMSIADKVRGLAREGKPAAMDAAIYRDLSEHRRGQSEDKHGD